MRELYYCLSNYLVESMFGQRGFGQRFVQPVPPVSLPPMFLRLL